jgi:hypothetical protein
MFGLSILISLVMAILGIAPLYSLKKSGERFTAMFISGSAYFLISFFIVYLGMPSIAYPLLGTYFIILMVWWFITAIVAIGIYFNEKDNSSNWRNQRGGDNKQPSKNSYKIPMWVSLISISLLISTWIFSWAFWGNQDHKYADLIGKMDNKTRQHWSQDQQSIDPTHIRLVTYDLAFSLASTSLSDSSGHTLGSQFELDENHSTLQKIKNDYYYLIPIDFSNIFRWFNTNYVTDYVKVSATDPNAKPVLVKSNQKMKYTFGAFFGDNIERKLYKKYFNYHLEDFTFEEDDNGRVWWTVTASKPSIFWCGAVVQGVILFDPETGEDTFIPKSEIDNGNPKYSWIDRVIPKDLVQYYITLWGDLKDGWGNAVWWGGRNNLLKPETPVMNYSIDGRCVYVTPVTSIKSDQTMVGLIYTDARTGQSIFYTTEGGQTESSVIGTIETAIKNFPNWYASEQIVYENIYGEMCALVPILAKDNNGHANFQNLGIVSTKNKAFAIGKTPREALQMFVKTIMNSSTQLSTEATKDMVEIRDVVWRIGIGENNTHYIQFKKMKKAIVLSTSNVVEIYMTKEGDSVDVKYINSNESALPTVYFSNITNHIELSKNQESVQNQSDTRVLDQKNRSDVKDMKAAFDTLSDTEKMKLYNQLKKKKS